MSTPSRIDAPHGIRQSHPHPGWASRLLLPSVLAALLFSVAMQNPPPKPLDPPNLPVRTYTLYIPSVFNKYLGLSGPDVPFAYGWSVFQYQSYYQRQPGDPQRGSPQSAAPSFTGIKITATPDSKYLCGADRLPYNVLLRLNKPEANATPQQVADDTWQW